MKLALGAAQFGFQYGIASNAAMLSVDEMARILSFAKQSDIDTIDTAIAYGDSELNLGVVGVKKFNVITKIGSIPSGVLRPADWIFSQVKDSITRLKVDRLHGVLLHQPNQLKGEYGDIIPRALEALKAEGLVKKIGASIYSPFELDAILNACPIDIIQAPFSLIDRRLEESGWLERLKSLGVEVHARSIFLQGLLLMKKESIPEKFHLWQDTWIIWHDWLSRNNYRASEICLNFVSQFEGISKIVVGVDNLDQLKALATSNLFFENISYPNIACNDERLINPSNWAVL